MKHDRKICIILSAIVLAVALTAFGVYCIATMGESQKAHKDGMLVERVINEGKNIICKAKGKS